MKKIKVAVLFIAALSTVSFNSCTDGKDNKDVKSKNEPSASNTKAQSSSSSDGLKIGFIDMDSVSNNYEYQKDVKALLEANQKKAESTLKSKESAFQSRYQAFQKKAVAFQEKASKIRSQSEQAALETEANNLKNEEAVLAKLQEEYQTEQAKLSQEFQDLFTKHTQEFNDTIEHFLQEYGEKNGYDLLLGKSSSTGGVLYGKDAYDITNEVIEAMNERYKANKK